MFKQYKYSVNYSEVDKCFVAKVAEWPSLGAHSDDPIKALLLLMRVVKESIDDCIKCGDSYPSPTGYLES